VRYYVYASDAKIDMLYSQIPPGLLSRLVGELKLDVKVLAVSLRKRETDETLYSKLGVVERYLHEEMEVGSTAEPATWFQGQMALRSGVWGGAADGLLYFGGLQDGVQVALIGSAHHKVGQRGDPSAIQVSYSGLPGLFSVLSRDEPSERRESGRFVGSMPDDDESVVREVFDFATSLSGLPEPSEFLARRLLDRPVDDDTGPVRRVLVATPLYVALSEG
jgi:hypothetical protein